MDRETSRNLVDYLSTRKALNFPDDATPNPYLILAIKKLVGIEKFNRLMNEIGPPWPDANKVVERLFEHLNIKWTIENPGAINELDDRPKIFVANHPYGLPDAFALFQLLTQFRPKTKFFANKLLKASQLDDPRLLYVDPFGAVDSRGLNRKSIAVAIRHLRDGGDLALFPGRICSHLKTSDWTISDSNWTDQVKKFVDVSDGDMVPIYITGRNSMLFNLSGLIHPRIRTYLLLREFLRGGHDFIFRFGDPVSAHQLERVSCSISPGTFARSLVYGLKTGSPRRHELPQLIEPELRSEKEIAFVERDPVPTTGKEVKALLSQHDVILESRHFTIFDIKPGVANEVLDIICEIRFCAYSSETTVKSPDELRDTFDEYYHHLILWDERKAAIAGVYRYMLPDSKKMAVTLQNLVTNSIFHLEPDFINLLPSSMELGRAAILPEYQKTYSPLMLLWRAILEVSRKYKNIRYLFGPVSMGRKFSPLSRELLHRYVMRTYGDPELAAKISPRKFLDLQIPKEVDIKKLDEACRNFSQLGNIVNGIEGGKRMLPVLFRHYANMGCHYAGFGEWKELDHATTGLAILDLRNINLSFLNRYYGEEGAREFLANR